jgi:hypothetical protein
LPPSCPKDEGHFYLLLSQGLQGDADADNNRKITVVEMEQFFADNVPYLADHLKQITQEPSVHGDRGAVLVVYR